MQTFTVLLLYPDYLAAHYGMENKLTIDTLKSLSRDRRFIELAAQTLYLQTLYESTKEREDKYVRVIFDGLEFKVGPNMGRGAEVGSRITNPEQLYLCEDEAIMQEFYAFCRKAHRMAGYDMPGDYSPSLTAQHRLIDSQTELLQYVDRVLGTPFADTYGGRDEKLSQQTADRRRLGKFYEWIVAARAELAHAQHVAKAQSTLRHHQPHSTINLPNKMPIRLDSDVLDTLRNCTITGNQLTMPQLDRALYVKVNKALDCLGGKWNRKARAHLFDSDPRVLIEAAVTDEKVVDPKQEFQFFPTPPELARKMVNLVNLKPVDIVLEPSAGRAAITDALIAAGHPAENIRVCELHPGNREYLKSKGLTVIAEDFLSVQDIQVDVIIANPPFTKGQDIDHVRHMWKCLRPGGTIVTLTSPSWTFREDKKNAAFRDWIRDEQLYEEEIPAGTFKQSGTEIRTMLLVLHKSPAEAADLDDVRQVGSRTSAVQTPALLKVRLDKITGNNLWDQL